MVAKNPKPLKERLKETMAERGVKVPQLSKETGIPAPRIYKWYDENTKPKADDAEKLEKWISGEQLEKPIKSYREQRLEQKLNGTDHGIPVYETAPQTLTNTPVYRDERTGQADFWITIPDLRDCDYGFRAKGDSMHPLIRNRALVIGREIKDKSIIIFGDIYIVHTTNNLETVKYVQQDESDPDRVVLVPFNEKAKTTTIHKNEILRLFEARAVFNPL